MRLKPAVTHCNPYVRLSVCRESQCYLILTSQPASDCSYYCITGGFPANGCVRNLVDDSATYRSNIYYTSSLRICVYYFVLRE